MTAVVIKRKLESFEIIDIINLIGNTKGYVIFTNINLPEEFKNFEIHELYNDNDAKRNINYETLKKINDFGDKTINNKPISEYLTFEKAGIWHYHKFRIYFLMRNLSYEINEIKYYSDNFEKVLFYTDKRELKLYKNLPQNTELHILKRNTQSKLNYKTVINYSIFFTLRIIISLFKHSSLRRKKHIIIDHTKRQICLDISTLREVKDNYNLSYLLNKADKDFVILREVFIPKFKDKETFILNREYFWNYHKRYKRIFSEFVVFRAIFNIRLHKQRKLIIHELRGIYKLIQSQELTPEEDMISKYLTSFHKTSTYYVFKYLAYKYFFSKYNFNTVSSIDENSAIIKTIMDSAKSLDIKTIGIQHGNIHDLHPAYIFTPIDKKNKVMPDYTLVWGKFYKDFLATKGNYPEVSIITVGQLRTDIIPVISNQSSVISNQSSVISQQSKKIVLFASQPQRDTALRYKAAFDVFASVKDEKDIFLYVKLHPNELNDFNYYHSIAKEAGCSNYEIIYYYDLYLLLSRSDIVITCFSTVGTEAVYFNKPLIILDYLKHDIQNYYKSGVAFQAKGIDELRNYIKDILSGKLLYNKKAHEDFINLYAYKIDGKVSERCIDFIKSFAGQ